MLFFARLSVSLRQAVKILALAVKIIKQACYFLLAYPYLCKEQVENKRKDKSTMEWQILIIIAAAILILIGKGDFLIAGYNTASKEDKEKCNVKRLRIIVASVLISGAVLTAFRSVIGSGLVGAAIILICIVGIVLANTWAQK